MKTSISYTTQIEKKYFYNLLITKLNSYEKNYTLNHLPLHFNSGHPG